MDLHHPGRDMYETFCRYQTALLDEFDQLSAEYDFQTIDASQDVRSVCKQLQANILQVLEGNSHSAPNSGLLQIARTAKVQTAGDLLTSREAVG